MPKQALEIIVEMRRIRQDNQYCGSILIKGLDRKRKHKIDYTILRADKKGSEESPVTFVNLKGLKLNEELYGVFNLALLESLELLEAKIDEFKGGLGENEIGLSGGYARDFNSKKMVKSDGEPNSRYLEKLSSQSLTYKISKGFEIRGRFNVEELFSDLPHESLMYLKNRLEVKAMQKRQI